MELKEIKVEIQNWMTEQKMPEKYYTKIIKIFEEALLYKIFENHPSNRLEPLVMQKIIKAKIIKHSRRKSAWFDPFINQIIDVIHIGSKSYLDVGDWYIIAEDYRKYLMQPGTYHKGMRYIKGNFLDFNNFSA